MSKPNVLLFVADDMGYGDFGLFNDGPARTPHLDALANEGLCLAQHYAGAPAQHTTGFSSTPLTMCISWHEKWQNLLVEIYHLNILPKRGGDMILGTIKQAIYHVKPTNQLLAMLI